MKEEKKNLTVRDGGEEKYGGGEGPKKPLSSGEKVIPDAELLHDIRCEMISSRTDLPLRKSKFLWARFKSSLSK